MPIAVDYNKSCVGPYKAKGLRAYSAEQFVIILLVVYCKQFSRNSHNQRMHFTNKQNQVNRFK